MQNWFKQLFHKRKEENGNKAMAKGMLYGGVVLLLVVLVVLLIVFRSQMKVDFLVKDDGSLPLRYTIITQKDCAQCYDIDLVLTALKQYNIKEVSRETLYLGDKKTDELVKKYSITKVPTVIVSGNLDRSKDLKSSNPGVTYALGEIWNNLGEIVDGVFILRQVAPPYVEVSTDQIRGLAKAFYITDVSCKECYDVMLHEKALLSLGTDIKDKTVIDINSDAGKALIKQYDIKTVPTIVLQGDLTPYTLLNQFWGRYGQITADKTYIFTKLDEVGTYRDLTTNKIIKVDLPVY